jgi:hypothetical protein
MMHDVLQLYNAISQDTLQAGESNAPNNEK